MSTAAAAKIVSRPGKNPCRSLFYFGPPPRGRAIPEWMWDGPIAASVSLADLVAVFEPESEASPHLLTRYRVALIGAARKRAEGLGDRPPKPIELTREDLKTLRSAVRHEPCAEERKMIENAGQVHPPAVSASRDDRKTTRLATALAWVAARRTRDEALGAALFSDPAWEMLLNLYVRHAQDKRSTVSSLRSEATVPQSTAFRWIATLEQYGLLHRISDCADRRRSFLALTTAGLARMECVLDSAAANADPHQFRIAG